MTLLSKHNNNLSFKYIDLFCGIGGFRVATEIVCKKHQIQPLCVFSSTWRHNFICFGIQY